MITDVTNIMPATYTEGTGSSQSLGQTEFLQLLVMQLQNQDPMDPVKNADFVAQLATFSSLEQLVNINSTLTELGMLESSINNSQAVNLIGKQITVLGDSIALSGGNASRASFVLNEAAESVTVKINDSSGTAVRTIELGGKEAGQHEVFWDGLNDAGEAVSDGNYTFSVTAKGEEDATLTLTLFANVLVEGITFSDGYVYLISGDQKYLLSDVAEVRMGQ
ncbi:MAG TPA: FlgD immunoglobulin-like domain containing protein [Acidobacteriota bacterium]|nr:FlgD immunoglobulin-like domain containing protein [Acidobacteriota bacterium]